MMWTLLLAVLVTTSLVQCHIGEDSHQDHKGEPLVFTSFGDWGTGTSAQSRVAQAMANYADDNQVDFHVTTGDNFYDGVNSATDPWFDTRWRDIYFQHDSLQYQRWYISVGNHDYYPYGEDKEWNQVARHEIDDQWYFPHLWYCLHFENTAAGNVDIWMLDTQAMRKDMNNWRDMMDWLEQELSESSADWKVFAGHHPGYTIGNHALGSSTIRNYLVPLMDQYNVDMFLHSHDHNIQHLRRIGDDMATDHILIGGGGRSLYEEKSGAREDLESQYNMGVEYWKMTYGFSVITFDEVGMRVDVIDDNNELVYSYTRQH